MVILALWEGIILYKSVCCVTEDVFTIKPGVDVFFFFLKKSKSYLEVYYTVGISLRVYQQEVVNLGKQNNL